MIEDERLIDWEAVLGVLMVVPDGGPAGAVWHLQIEIDLRERILSRPEQKAYLARYARIPWHAWAGRSVAEMTQAINAVSKVVERENAADEAMENR